MLLLLIRHAHAGDRDPDQWPDDRDRPLTKKGRKRQRVVSRALARLGARPTLVLTSPWTRARQTAELLADELTLDSNPVPCDGLAASPALTRLTEAIGQRRPSAVVALVGHSPWIEELGGILLAGAPESLRIDFPKGGVLGIDLEALLPGSGELRFFLRPEMA
jgi:phosphohistidine phosphatase